MRPSEDRAAVPLSQAEARAIAVRSARPDPVGEGGMPGVLRHLGAVQLDSISTLARAHQLTLAARLPGATGTAVDEVLWADNGEPLAFDFPAHALALVPVEDWPLWAFRRRATRLRREYPDRATARAVLERVAADGPLTLRKIRGDEAGGGGGWDWGPVKTAVEFLVWSGELACVHRDRWQRLFGLPERAVPARFLTDALSDDECLLRLLEKAGRVLGVATGDSLADYIRIRPARATTLLPGTSLVPVAVEGWDSVAWGHPAALADERKLEQRAEFIGPFDNLIWHRPRVDRLFGFNQVLEAYKPAARRVHGYYVCPLLVGDRLVGRADLARRDGTLTVLRASVDNLGEAVVDGFAEACHRMAAVVCPGDARTVVMDDAADPATVRALRSALLRMAGRPSSAVLEDRSVT
ncbi:DNA glycosylase AlkZ-like family protein [Streptomyces sp. CA-249302]|uniref:DNA glycosylase AlkZ-like family protein n=1 Tax=Streptomyces sp. CA-249302 TaxID=3240058 RepID=UPI003D8F1F89